MLIRNGLKVAYQEFGANNPKKVLALHGWLDNSSSFMSLGPYLADKGYHVLAIDHIGHGHSSHFPPQAFYQIPNYVNVVKNVIGELGWSKTTIVGHSMGGAIGLLYSAAFRDVDKLVVIDNLGPMTFPADQATNVLRKYIEFQENLGKKEAIKASNKVDSGSKIDSNRDSKGSAVHGDKKTEGYIKGLKITGSGGKIYETISDAVLARLKTVTTLPGKQYLSREAAEYLVKRGVIAVSDDSALESPSSPFYSDIKSGPVRFRHDPRLSYPSHMYFTPEQVNNFIDNISCPVLVVTGEDGWPISSADEIAARVKILTDKKLLTYHQLPGSHHLHLDPNTAPLVSEKILDFLSK